MHLFNFFLIIISAKNLAAFIHNLINNYIFTLIINNFEEKIRNRRTHGQQPYRLRMVTSTQLQYHESFDAN